MKKLLLFSLLMLTCFGMARADIIEVGNGSDEVKSDALPTSARYEYSLTEQIYTSSDIGASGTISSIAFYKISEGELTRNLDIYMKPTKKSAFSSGTDWINVAWYDKVFSGEVTFEAEGWTTIKLTVPYEYSDNENLVILIDDNTGDYSDTRHYFRTMDATSKSLIAHGEFTNYNPDIPSDMSTYTGSVFSQKAQIQFGFTPLRDGVVKVGGGGLQSWSIVPTYFGHKYAITEQIYTASEIGTAGTITSLTFKTGPSEFKSMSRGIDVYMMHTSKSSFSSINDWVQPTEADKVYSGGMSVYHQNAFVRLDLDTPFDYDGTSNLVILFVAHNDAGQSGPYVSFLTYDTSSSQVLSDYNSIEPFKVNQLNTYNGTQELSKNQIWFDIQPLSVIGDGTLYEYDNLPISTSTKYSLSQQIYLGSEIGQQGVMNGMSFYVTSGGGYTRDLEVYLIKTSKTSFADNTEWVTPAVGNNAQKVFNGNVTLTNGWNKIAFDAPFEYDGTSNLIVAIRDKTGTAAGTTKFSAYYHYPETRALTRTSDTDTDFHLSSGKGTLPYANNRVMFSFQEDWHIGEGTLASTMPTYTYYKYSISEQVYTYEEMGKPGTITSLGFYSASNSGTKRLLDIYMIEDNAWYWSGENGHHHTSLSDAYMVFSGEVYFPSDKWTDIPLNRSFTYQHISDAYAVSVIVIDRTGSYQSPTYFRSYETEGKPQVWYDNRDTEPYDMENIDVEGNVSNIKNQIRFNIAPLDVRPVGLRVYNLEFCKASVAWNSMGGVSNYEFQYKPSASDDTAWITLTTSNSYTTSFSLEGLTPRTDYDIQVRAKFSSGEFSDWTKGSFSTDLVPTSMEFTDVTYQSATATWKSLGSKWDFQYKPSDESAWQGVSGLTEKTYVLKGLTPETQYDVRVRTIDDNDNYSSWYTMVLASAERYPRPTDIIVEVTPPSTAYLKWTEHNDATAWQICLNDDEENLIEVNTNPCFLRDLEMETHYSVKIRSVITEGELYSNWSGHEYIYIDNPNYDPYNVAAVPGKNSAKITWTGASDSYEVRYRKQNAFLFTGFEDPSDIAAWGEKDLHTSSGVSSNDGLNYSGAFRFYYTSNPPQYIVTPELDGIPEGSLVEFYYRISNTSYPESFKVGYSTTTDDLTDPEVYTWGEEITETESEWKLYQLTLPAGVKYIAIQCTSDDKYSLYLDNFKVYDPTADNEWASVETTETEATLTGLEPWTFYECEVVGLMKGFSDASSGVSTFMTNLTSAPISDFAVETTNSTAHITWTGESDSYQLMYRAPEHKVRVGESFFEDFEGLVDGALPDGWTAVDADADGYNWYSYNVKADDELIDYNSNLRAFGTSCAISASWAGGSPLNPDNWLITPQLDLRDVMSVWVRGYHPGYAAEKFAVYLSTTGTDISDFTIELIPETTAEDHFMEYLAYLGTYEGKKGYIAIRHFNVTDMYRLNVDNFGIFQGYETVPASDWVTIETTEPDVMITGLEKNTAYEYKVIARSQDEADQETSVMTFTTADDAVDIVLDCTVDNANKIYQNDGVFANVTINNLTLKKDGKWQTIWLPFDVEVEGSLFEGAKVRTIESVWLPKDASLKTVVADCLTPVTSMKANIPYIVKWESGDDIENPVFNEVLVKYDSYPQISVSGGDGLLAGRLEPYTAPYDYTDYFIIGDEMPILSFWKEGYELQAFRAYFVFGYGSETFVLNTGEDDDLITGIASLKAETDDEVIYNVAGQRLGKKQRGINIVNGKKVLVK